MKTPKKLGPTQAALLPLIMKLSEAGHLPLALKTLGLATRTDWAVIRRQRARARYTRKLEKLMEQLDAIQADTCKVLHPDHQ